MQNPQPALPLDQPQALTGMVRQAAAGIGISAEQSCLDCGAELSRNDLRAGHCAICGKPVSSAQKGSFELLRGQAPSFDADKTIGETEWPSEAPLW